MGRSMTVHRLGRPGAARSPDRLVVLDTETTPVPEGDGERHVLRLWAATLIRRHGVDPGQPRLEDADGRTGEELADRIDAWAPRDGTCWVVAHNLAFDLAVTQLPLRLVRRGWRLTESALTAESPWARLARGRSRITLADTWSWLPTSVEDLGRLIGEPKVPLPDWSAGDDAWLRRCRTDVAITASAFLACLDWWDAEKLGAWGITGPATGWTSYRARAIGQTPTIDPDPAARAFEMRAVTGGRREVRGLGLVPATLVADLDLITAHLTAMSTLGLPRRRIARFDRLRADHPFLDGGPADVLAEVEVEVEAPRYPLPTAAGVVYPVGRFRTVLAGPEIREARARGELRGIGPGYAYALSIHMAEWARWVAGLLDARSEVPGPVRVMAKHWSRCVPGKWASRTGATIDRVPDPRPGWLVERAALMPEGRPADLLVVEGERWTIVRDEWADHAFPGVLAWIQSATRVALARLLDALGGGWVSCNTDGVLVAVDAVLARHGRAIPIRPSTETARLQALDDLVEGWNRQLAPFVARIKGAARQVTVLSPQHALVDGERRLAGIPRRAVDLGGLRFEFTTWPKLRLQLERPWPPGFRTRRTVVEVGAIRPLGWRLVGDVVVPWRVERQPDGTTILCRPEASSLDPDLLAPPEAQHPLAARVLAGDVVVLEPPRR